MSKVRWYNCQNFGHFATKFHDPSKKKWKQHASMENEMDQPHKKEIETKLNKMTEDFKKEYFFISALSGSIFKSS
jgi:hypothetical protein